MNRYATFGPPPKDDPVPRKMRARFTGYTGRSSRDDDPIFQPGQEIIVIDEGNEADGKKFYIGVASEEEADEHLRGDTVSGDELWDSEFEPIGRL